MPFSQEQKVYAVECVILGHSSRVTRQLFLNKFAPPVPDQRTISRWIKKQRNNGFVQDKPKNGRPTVSEEKKTTRTLKDLEVNIKNAFKLVTPEMLKNFMNTNINDFSSVLKLKMVISNTL